MGSAPAGPRTRTRTAALTAAVLAVGAALAAGLGLLHLLQGAAGYGALDVLRAVFAPADDLVTAVVRSSRLPRLGVALVCGAALGAAGALMQTVTRNPLASPATLGVNAGAYLALVAAAVVAPGLVASYGWWLAAAGGLGAAGLAVALGGTGSGSGSAARLALAGMAVSLALSAVTGGLQLLFENETQGLFLWGAGSLAQAGSGGVAFAAPRIGLALLAAMLLAPGLDLLRLGEDVARGLGARVALVRAAGGGVAVLLAASAVAVVGPIAFVGLLAPHLVRLVGVRPHLALLPASAVWGGALLVGADLLARAVPSGSTPLPAGAATAMLGAPFLIWLARRSAVESARSDQGTSPRRSRHAGRVGWWLLALVPIALAGGLMFGAVPIGPGTLASVLAGGGDELARRVVLELRLPRLLVAGLVGAALAAGGVLLQGVVRNPLAAPEIVGTTSGASVAALGALLLLPDMPPALLPVAAFTGGVLAFAGVYAASWKRGLSPLRLALVGLGASAFLSAIVNTLVVAAGLRVAQALTWLAGSTYARSWNELAPLVPWLAVLLPLAQLGAHRLDLLALGDDVPRTLGLRLERGRAALLALSVALTAAAVATVGTLSFVGLMAPHMARGLVGSAHRRRLPVAALLGALLVITADTVGRTAFAPRELPSGLLTAALGAPYFLLLLTRGTRR